jgi:1-acyl-sn-glycerol-3-phosphate acyltransferase
MCRISTDPQKTTTPLRKAGSKLYKFCRAIAKVLFKIFYRVKVVGEITLPEDKGYIICSNHIHAIDPGFIGCFTKRPISFMGKKELFEKPILGWFFRKIDGFPVDREKGDIGAVKTAIEILNNNKVMAMFPEGTRSKTGELGEFKRGAAVIALRANAPIVPVKIEGNYKLFSKMTLKIGSPVFVTKENQKTIMNDIKNTIQSL